MNSNYQKEIISRIIDYTINFDEKSINIAFFFNAGRSGSSLLQSLLDSHKNILMFPGIYPIFFRWNNENKEELVNKVFFYPEASPYTHYFLGEKQNEVADLKLEETKDLFQKVFEELPEKTIKNYTLAYHFSYATIHNYDFQQIKTIFIHHHYPLCGKTIQALNNGCSFDDFSFDFFDDINQMFPKSLLLFTLRDPFESYYSLFNYILHYNSAKSSKFDINHYMMLLVYTSYTYLHIIKIQKQLAKRFKLIYFEDIHLKTRETIDEIINFLNVEYDECLLKSTIDGKLWWGNNPLNPINGTNPNMAVGKWKNKMTGGHISLCKSLYNPIMEHLGYEKHADINILAANKIFVERELISWITNKDGWLSLIFILLGWLVYPSFWKKTVFDFMKYLYNWLYYPILKIKFVKHFKQLCEAL